VPYSHEYSHQHKYGDIKPHVHFDGDARSWPPDRDGHRHGRRVSGVD
jgi:hypothetical protein